MIPLFTLPLDQLRAEHVETLRREEVPEGQNVEFKRTLAARSGRTAPWLDGGDEVGDHGRNDVLKEVVAFANSGGGNVVLGIVESGDHPRRAVGVNHLPHCHELADRFRLMARDCIDPQLPSLEACGVPMPGGDEHAGVVLFRVPPSRPAPHRLKPTKHCYLRRADRTEEMTMREIQDISVRLARGGDAIDERMEESREHYLEVGAGPKGDHTQYEVGARATALPVGGSIYINQVYQAKELKQLRGRMAARIDGDETEAFLPGWSELLQHAFRPGLRSGSREARREDRVTVESVHSDGLVEFFYKHVDQNKPIYIRHILAMAANALLVADAARRVAGVPGAELLLDVELRCDLYQPVRHTGIRTAVINMERHSTVFDVSLGNDNPEVKLGPQPLHLPLQSVSHANRFRDALNVLVNDLMNACGFAHVGQFAIDLGSGK